jgi:hypothetical protein
MSDRDYNQISDDDFRAEVRSFFENNYPSHLRFLPRRVRWTEIKDWYLRLSSRGWIAPNWPREYGGMGLSPAKLLIFIEETERWGIPRAPDHGIVQLGPILIQYGTAPQRDYYLPKILAGEHVWCQGYSEPNAGSDLASLRTTAVLEGDHFVVNGQKIWTTHADEATHMYALVRTNNQVKKQEGISFLLIDMKTSGIAVRPIKNLTGHHEFCEVFFENTRVPKNNLVGELNEGWTIAKALLSIERVNIGSPRRPQYALRRLEMLARAKGLFDDPGFVDKFTQLKLDMADLASLYARYVEIVKRGETPGQDVSALKIWASETWQRITDLLVETAAEYGAIEGPVQIDGVDLNVLSPFYYSRPATILGGSNEIQRNILAKYVLNLPS